MREELTVRGLTRRVVAVFEEVAAADGALRADIHVSPGDSTHAMMRLCHEDRSVTVVALLFKLLVALEAPDIPLLTGPGLPLETEFAITDTDIERQLRRTRESARWVLGLRPDRPNLHGPEFPDVREHAPLAVGETLHARRAGHWRREMAQVIEIETTDEDGRERVRLLVRSEDGSEWHTYLDEVDRVPCDL